MHQLRLITTAQLQRVGLTHRCRSRRLERGLLTRVHTGVYLWGGGAPPPGGIEFAAVLACGPGTVVSHESAATLWGLVVVPVHAVSVTVPGRSCRSRSGIDAHRVADLHPADRSDVRGIPVTAPARTLIDLAGRHGGEVLERALSEAFARRLVTERELDNALARAPRRKGVAALRELLKTLGGPSITRSHAERLLRRLVRDAGLPPPQTNVKLEGHHVDAWWPQHNLALEFDGFDVHGHRLAFERDRANDQRLVAAGYRVMRITWRQLTEQPLRVVANLAAALARGTPCANRIAG